MRPEKEFTIKIGEASYQLVSDDEYLEQMDGDYEPSMVKLFGSLVRENDCALDVGASVGCTSILLGQQTRQVVTFEAWSSTFGFLAASSPTRKLRWAM